MAKTADVLAWLDARGWPHDPWDLTKEQDAEMRRTLSICGHRTRKKQPCAFPPMANGRCKRAGGPSRKGASHPNYQGKGRSRYLPGSMRDRYKDLNEAGLLDLGHQLKLMAIREEMLLKRIDPDETGKTWKALKQEWSGLQAALRRADRKEPGAEDEVRQRIMGVTMLIGRGATDAEAWEELAKPFALS